MITPTQQFAMHITARLKPVRDRVDQFMQRCDSPEARAAAFVDCVMSVEETISECAAAWRAHWAYTAFAETMPQLYRQTPDHDPYAVAVWRHDAPGRGGREFSYMVSQISDLIDPVNMRWGEKNLGVFAFIRPIEHDDEPHPTRIQSEVYAIKRKAAYADLSRQALKKWLPKSLHHLISDVRSRKECHKSAYLRSIQESATQRLNEFVQRQREDFENFSAELVQHVARLVAELPPIGSTMASNKDTEGK